MTAILRSLQENYANTSRYQNNDHEVIDLNERFNRSGQADEDEDLEGRKRLGKCHPVKI